MKRPLVFTLSIGLVVTAIVSALHATGWLVAAEFAISEFVRRYTAVINVVAGPWQYVFTVLLSFGVAWVTLASKRRVWGMRIFIVLLIELVAVTWVCTLYHIFFQPLPSILAVLLSFTLAHSVRIMGGGNRARRAAEMFAAHLSREQLERVVSGELTFEAQTTVHEASVLMCDLAQKYERAEDSSPEALARMVDQFVRFATDTLLKEGAYLHAADGEGVVAIFGFPVDEADHAEKAAIAALRMVRAYGDFQQKSAGVFDNIDVHLGISSGSIIAARFQNGDETEIVPIGEPLELSRRFSMANRAYGSRILLGPQTFQLAQDAIVARPIDFLGGAGVREWLEMYELISLAGEVTAEEMARRDNFWNGVVYYREKRWGEAYAEFQKAFADNGSEDAPLQFYLRRLEPLVLHLVESFPSDSNPRL